MNVADTYSHLNGLEYLQIHRNELWNEINAVIRLLDADTCKIKNCEDKNTSVYNYEALNNNLKKFLIDLNWEKVTNNSSLKRTEDKEREHIKPSNFDGIDFIKERVAIEILLSEYCFENLVLFEKHLAQYVMDMVDVGISILPMKSLQVQMSSGVPYYEGELYNVIRQGRGVPAVPLVIVGIMP